MDWLVTQVQERNPSLQSLIYAWQSGALNEAYSDVFGETIDLTNGVGLDNPNNPRTEGNCTAFTPARGQFQINSPGSVARIDRKSVV